MNYQKYTVLLVLAGCALGAAKGDEPAREYAPVIRAMSVINPGGPLVDIVMLPSVKDMVNPDSPAKVSTIAEGMIEIYTKQVNAILAECRKDLTPANYRRMLQAARLAAGLRLEGCVEELVKCSGIAEPLPSSIREGRIVLRHWGDLLPVPWALARIGKASVQPMLEIAANPSSSNSQLAAAGIVLKEVEGELAQVVIERFIAKSPDPALVKRMLERKYFVNRWKEPVDTKETSEGK